MNLLFRVISLIKGYATALLQIDSYDIELEDIDILMDIERNLEKLVRKYNSKWFDPIKEDSNDE